MLNLLKEKDEKDLSDYSLKTDVFDEEDIEEVMSKEDMQGFLSRYSEKYHGIGSLVADTTLAHYQYDPTLLDSRDIKPSSRFHRELISRLLDEHDTQMMRLRTEGCMSSSVMCASNLVGMLMKWVEEEQEKKGDESIANMVNDLIDIENCKDPDSPPDGLMEKYGLVAGGYGSGSEKLEAIQNHITGKLDDVMKKKGKALDKIVSANTSFNREEIMGKVEKIKDMAELLGNGKGMSLDAQLKLAQRLSESDALRMIAEMIGKLKGIAKKSRRNRYTIEDSEIQGITIGDDLNRIVPTALMNLSKIASINGFTDEQIDKLNKIRKAFFMQDYISKSLPVYDIKQKEEEEQQGSIICLVDSSGSMHGTQDAYAKAIAGLLLELARQDKRNFSLGIFADVGVIRTWTFKGDEDIDPDVLTKALAYYIGGGTDFETPLTVALDIIEDETFKDADVVMITDGVCGVSDAFVERYNGLKEEKNFQLYSIVLDTRNYYKTTLEKISDMVIETSVFNEANQINIVEKLFRNIR